MQNHELEGTRFPWRVYLRIVFFQTILVCCGLVGAGLTARFFFKRQYIEGFQRQLHDTLVMLDRDVPVDVPANWCTRLAAATELRVTLIRRDGVVVCDSHHDPETMENHAGRPEVLAAWKTGYGQSIRFSHTLGLDMLYGAIPAKSVILRVALPAAHLATSLKVFDHSLTLAALGFALLLAGFSAWVAQQLVAPLGRAISKSHAILQRQGEGVPPASEEKSRAKPFGEWHELETTIDSIKQDLDSHVEALATGREEQAALMGAVSEAVFAVNDASELMFHNQKFAALFPHKELAKGENLSSIFRDVVVIAAFRNVLRGGLPADAIDTTLILPDGNRYYALSISPLRRGGQDVYGAIGVLHDITELKLAEQTRIDFVANVSHELRTPLTSIRGYVETLAIDQAEKRPLENRFFEIILRSIDRLTSLVNDLLNLSTLESANAIQRSMCDTEALTGRVLQQVSDSWRHKHQRYQVVNEAPLVEADSQRLEQVVVNLLENASKYSPDGAEIHVRWEAAADGIYLKVKDNGPGIPKDHLGRIFERFYRVDKARSRELGGTGLGLAIVKSIMSLHGGTAQVISGAGEGAEFICFFPWSG